jgi:hypothetical protein
MNFILFWRSANFKTMSVTIFNRNAGRRGGRREFWADGYFASTISEHRNEQMIGSLYEIKLKSIRSDMRIISLRCSERKYTRRVGVVLYSLSGMAIMFSLLSRYSLIS